VKVLGALPRVINDLYRYFLPGLQMPLVKFLLRHALIFYVSCALLTVALMVLVTGVISQYELVEKGVQARGVVVA
jgi:hypothetical protein